MPKSSSSPDGPTIRALGQQFSTATIRLHEAIARRAGLSGTDHKYLHLLLEHGPMTAGELARRAHLTTGAVTGLIDRLAGKGLVRREADPADRRRAVVVPDPAQAAAVLGSHFAGLESRIADLLAGYSAPELALIEGYLRATIDVMTTVTGELAAAAPTPDPEPTAL